MCQREPLWDGMEKYYVQDGDYDAMRGLFKKVSTLRECHVSAFSSVHDIPGDKDYSYPKLN